MHLSAADRLREMGRDEPARRAERFAAGVRFDLNEPQAARRVYAAAGKLRRVARPGLLFGEVLEGALSLAGADRGNLQLLNPMTGSLRIVAEHGFGAEFLEYFAVVEDDRSACGRVVKCQAQTVIADITTDPGFAPHRAIAAASGFRAVLSTPLIGLDGRLMGVISTHYPHPYYPSARERQVMTRYGELAGRVMADQLTASPDGRAGGRLSGPVAALGRAAQAHDNAARAHERSVQAGVGDVAEHKRLAEFHWAAAAADRQRAEEAEAWAMDPSLPGYVPARPLTSNVAIAPPLRRRGRPRRWRGASAAP
jgi:hypothetical protein